MITAYLLAEIIKSHPDLTYLSKLLSMNSPLPSPLPKDLDTSEHLTVFAPSNDAFDGVFDDIERGYLEGAFGGEGVGRIVGGGVVTSLGKDGVGWRDRWGKKGYEGGKPLAPDLRIAYIAVESASGLGLLVEAPTNGSLIINGTEASTIDIFASNGKYFS